MSEEDSKRIFSMNLQKYINLNGKSQVELSKYMHVSTATVSDWCNGRKMPRIDKIQSLANYFKIQKSDLIDDKLNGTAAYYLDPETAALAQELKDNPDLHVLMDAGRNMTPKEIKALIAFVQAHKDDDND